VTSAASDSPASVGKPQSCSRLDRSFWLAVLLTTLIVIPRSLWIAHAHSESYDDQYHLIRGLALLTREPLPNAGYDNPPFAEILSAIPLWVTGCKLGGRDAGLHAILYGQPLSPETLLMLEAGWKAILFIPAASVLFLWCRRLYGERSAWLALAIVLVDPTIAAHMSTAATDVLAAEAILIACYVTWRYLEEPTRARLIATAAALACAIAMKHTCIIVLPTALMYAIIHWKNSHDPSALSRTRVLSIALLIPLFVWAFNAFDISRPRDHCELVRATYTEHWSFAVDVINANLARRWPCGVHIASVFDAIVHAREGHLNYLFGEVSRKGWWYYQFIVAAFKVPIGVFVVLMIGLASLIWRRFRLQELTIVVPLIFYLIFIVTSTLDIGFRHALPAYVLMIMLASRILAADVPTVIKAICWIGVCIAAGDVIRWHPDEVSYINGPWWTSAPRVISDSNIDWGQSLKQVRSWIDAHPEYTRRRPVYLAYFGDEWASREIVGHYLGDRIIADWDDLPDQGIVVVSPVLVWGAYAPPERFKALRDREPIAIIGHSMRVYHLDRR
jgi:hypothetical protein